MPLAYGEVVPETLFHCWEAALCLCVFFCHWQGETATAIKPVSANWEKLVGVVKAASWFWPFRSKQKKTIGAGVVSPGAVVPV